VTERPLDPFWKEVVWNQFGASIDALENAIDACPPEVWGDAIGPHEFWYLVYHTLFWLDYRLHPTAEGFAPRAPFTLGETDPAGVYPDRIYSKAEMKSYLAETRAKCRTVMSSMTEEGARRPWGKKTQFPRVEWMIYTMRHTQHHAAQLNLLLRQRIDSAPRWPARAAEPLESA